MIDESLDPKKNPAKEGRYRFTLAHEGGHWRLHRHLFAKDPAQASLVRRLGRTDRDLPFEPGEGADRMAGGFLCVVPADAAPAVFTAAWTRAFRTASSASSHSRTCDRHYQSMIARIE